MNYFWRSHLIRQTFYCSRGRSQNNSIDIIKPITTQFANIPNITEPVSLQTIDESNSHTNGDKISTIVIQTQTVIDDSYADSDQEERKITEPSDGPQFDEITKQLNNVFDDSDDYLSAELEVITNHRFLNSLLEFHVDYKWT